MYNTIRLTNGPIRSALIPFAALLLAPVAALLGAETAQLTLIAEPARVELATQKQKLVFAQTGGVFLLTTLVRDGQEWRPLFDAGRPLLEGPLFGSQPTRYTVLTSLPERKVVEFGGRHREPEYDWSMRVEATADSPLFRFTITCQLPGPLTLDTPQPVVALWMRHATPAFHLDEGPDSIYGSAGIPHGYGFPAAYLWDAGREAAVFFNMTPMRWMQTDGVWRFHDVRVMTRVAGGQAGLGMHFKKISGRRLPAGEMVVEFFLYQGVRSRRPTGLEAVDTMLRAFAPLHPAESVFPRNYLTGGAVSWEQFARQAMDDLTTSPETCCETRFPWRDEPLELVPRQQTMVVHPAQAMADPSRTARDWDFSTVNNHLTPSILLARLSGDAKVLRLALLKKDALPRFYDPRARLIRHGTRQPPHVGDLEMTWQNLFFHLESVRAAAAVPASDFNPAVPGRFLMATAGLRELAANVDYAFPQWFDPYGKRPVVQNDVKSLGVVREPWQVGLYAYLMLQAFDMTADRAFLDEARRSIEALTERMQFNVRNALYDRHYADPAEFPVTELFGNAYGIAASYRLYEATGREKFLRDSRDFLNTLLRLTFWYEDETDPVSRELRSAGLFYPHGGAHVATPWENVEAHLMIAWALKHDRDNPLTDLLVKLSNLNRINAFYFFPAAWSPTVQAIDQPRRKDLGQNFPIEAFYSLEGIGGHRGPTAAYMAGLALWNDWLYSALAEATDREIMVLNLDGTEDFESALTGMERHFLVYNPGPIPRDCRLISKHLPEGDYLVAAGSREERRSAAELTCGLSLALRAGEFIRLTIRHVDYRRRRLQLAQDQAARNALARAYQALQERATRDGPAAVAPQETGQFAQACRACSEGRFVDARDLALRLVQESKRPPGHSDKTQK